jgi:hypothetical protein
MVKKRHSREWKIHQNNTTGTLGQTCAATFSQTPHFTHASTLYLLDTVACDFSLFHQIKKALKAKLF